MQTHPEEPENLSWPPPAVLAAHQHTSSSFCSPNESSKLCLWISISLSVILLALQLHISALCQLYSFFSHSDEEFQLIQICKSSMHVWLSFPPPFSSAKLSAPSPSRHSSLRTQVHIFSPKALSWTTPSFPVWLSGLTSLIRVWRPGLAPLLNAGNWQSACLWFRFWKLVLCHGPPPLWPVSIPPLQPLSSLLAPSLLL